MKITMCGIAVCTWIQVIYSASALHASLRRARPNGTDVNSSVHLHYNRSVEPSTLSHADIDTIDNANRAIDRLPFSRFVKYGGDKRKIAQTIWIVGIGRSGTTLLQDIMVAAAVGQGASTFAAFEPCHSEDIYKGTQIRYADSLSRNECMRRALQCDFDDLQQRHFSELHSKAGHWKLHSKAGAFFSDSEKLSNTGHEISLYCQASSLRVFKTIHPVATTKQEMNQVAGTDVSVIRISRDIHSVYSSMQGLHDSADFMRMTPAVLCNIQHQWVAESDFAPNFIRIKFEDLVTQHPEEVPMLLAFLNWNGSQHLDRFLGSHMSSASCAGDASAFGTCRTPEQTQAVLVKWENQLSIKQQSAFEAGTCPSAVKAFGYHDLSLPSEGSRAAKSDSAVRKILQAFGL